MTIMSRKGCRVKVASEAGDVQKQVTGEERGVDAYVELTVVQMQELIARLAVCMTCQDNIYRRTRLNFFPFF